ncbi:MAG TPA: hypothetical protein VFX16_24005 [Pseudonocardiaceae bacterium]|nr:hypothetical protein [Pseudonocardiaceae bacterium]
MIGAGVLLVLVAGCAKAGTVAVGSGDTLSTTGPTTTTTAPHPTVIGPPIPGVHLPSGAVQVPGAQVDAHALPSSFPREVWTEHGGTVLGFEGEDGGCFTSRATVDQQTDQQVTVRLIQQEGGTGEHACPQFLRYKPMSVNLAKPLGDRTVVLLMSIIRG